MSCSPFDLKDYFFGELRPPERAAVEEHIETCPQCADALRRLDLTRTALMSVAEQEPSRRIAFVSDKVFEPTWWQRLWHSGPQLGFLSAALLACAIVVHGFASSPAPTTAGPAAAAVNPVQIDQVVAAEVEKRVALEVAKAEERQMAQVMSVVNTRLKAANQQHREDLLLIRDFFERQQKGNAVLQRALYDYR